MLNNKGKKALVVIRDDLSSWLKAKVLVNIIAKKVAKFL
jgi:hypothetical protein